MKKGLLVGNLSLHYCFFYALCDISVTTPTAEARQGVIYAVCAYLMWGVAPVYFKQLGDVPAFEILSHRVVWSIFILLGLLWVSKQFSAFVDIVKHPKRMGILLVASVLLAANWLIYIWSVNQGRILEASLGYYVNPLLNVFMGAIFLNERFRRLQKIAVSLVFVGVAILLIGFGSFPWIAISLAFSFSIYGLLRKMISVRPLPGLTMESVFMLPVALAYLWLFASPHSNLIENNWQDNVLLIGLGVLTTAPLLCFNAAAKRLQYSTIGFLQYIGPSIMFVIAVTVYDEPFSLQRIIIFGFVWSGVVLFSLDSLHSYRRAKR